MREVNAWSTLGWFNDPILTGFLYQPEGDLANLIIHELSHSTVFISGDVEESENLASFIGDYGARLYLIQKYGENSKQLEEYTHGLEDYRKLSLHLLRGSIRLDSLYSTPVFSSLSSNDKEVQKKSMIQGIIRQLDTITFSSPEVYSALSIRKKLPGNALFIEFRQYNNKQSLYEQEFKSQYGSDLKKYIQALVKRFS
jgi:predicted aminopeptidase